MRTVLRLLSSVLVAMAMMAMTLHSSSMLPTPTLLSSHGGNDMWMNGDLYADFTPTYDPPESKWDVTAIYAMCISKLHFKIYIYQFDQRALVTPFLERWGSTYENMMQYHNYHVENMYSWPNVLEELWRLEGIVTENPDEADLFYIPTHVMDLWMVGSAARDKNTIGDSIINTVLGEYVAAIVDVVAEAHPYWRRYGGARHVIMQPNDPGRCDFTTPRIKELLWNTTILHPNGNNAADYAACMGGASRDVIVPPRSVLGGFWKSDGALHTNSSWDRLFGSDRTSTFTACFSGSIQQGGGLHYSRGARQYLQHRLAGLAGFDYRERFKVMKDYVESLSTSDFSLHMPGHMLWSPRLFDSMAFGALPVVIGEYFVLPFESFIPYDEFVVRVGWNQLRFLPEILNSISPQRRLAMRATMRQYVPFLLYSENAHQATYASMCLKEKASLIHSELHQEYETIRG
ncbi:hypothetical protein ACHAXT_003777 [Thalassiosira profunda]